MASTITTHASADSADAIVATLRRDGAAIAANLVSPDAMDKLTAAFAFGDDTKVGNDFIGGADNRALGAVLHANPDLAEALVLNDRVLEVADRILLPEKPMAASSEPIRRPKAELVESDDGCAQFVSAATAPEAGPNCHHYRVGAAASIQARDGGNVQLLHREMAIYEPYVAHGPESRDLILNMMWAGTDFTVANGATRLVPGSHLWPADRLANESEVAQAVMPKGSVLFWLCRTLHGLGANSSGQRRTGIFHSLVVNWLAQEENQYLAFPADAASRLSLRARQVLGYRSSSTCGWVKGRKSNDLLSTGVSGPLEAAAPEA